MRFRTAGRFGDLRIHRLEALVKDRGQARPLSLAKAPRGAARLSRFGTRSDRRHEAMLLVTHDMDMVRQLTTRAALLADGKVVAEAPAADLLADTPLLTRHGLK